MPKIRPHLDTNTLRILCNVLHTAAAPIYGNQLGLVESEIEICLDFERKMLQLIAIAEVRAQFPPIS